MIGKKHIFKKGFTLVELVVVIAVIAILASVSVGAYFGVTNSAVESKLNSESKAILDSIRISALDESDNFTLNKDGFSIKNAAKPKQKFNYELNLLTGINYIVTYEEPQTIVGPTLYLYNEDRLSNENCDMLTYVKVNYYSISAAKKHSIIDLISGDISFSTNNKQIEEDKNRPDVKNPDEAVDFSQLTFTAFGDSITCGINPKINGKVENPYPTLVNEILGLKSFENKGVSGATFTSGNSGRSCMTDLITSYNSSADIIGVLGGVNDFYANASLGTIDDRTTSTIYGALHISMSYLKEYYEDSFLFYMTPYKCVYGWKYWYNQNSKGYSLENIANAIKEVADIYNIPVLDLFEIGGFESVMENSDCDGVHPNQEFITNKMAPQIAGFIQDNY